MELHAPRALAEPVGLAGGVVLGEELGARGQLEAVVVPLERLEPGRQDAEHRILSAGRVGLDHVPPHLVASRRPDARPGRAGDQLGAEADAEERHLAVDRVAEEGGLVGEPRMLRVLVGMHRAAEHHDRVVALRRRRAPCVVSGMTQRSSPSPRASTRSSNSPPPPVEPYGHREHRTREHAQLGEARRRRCVSCSEQASSPPAAGRSRPSPRSPPRRAARGRSRRSAARSRRGCC